MATEFLNKVIKDVGMEPILAIETNAGTRSTIIGISLANITEFPVFASILIHDDTSVSGYFLKDVMVPPNTSLRGLLGGEKLILATNNQLYIQADRDDAVDALISYVNII